MDKYTKEYIEEQLMELLDECLESGNQDGAIKSVTYDPEKNEAHIIMDVTIVPEDNYVGFQGY